MSKKQKEGRMMSNWSITSYGIGSGGVNFGVLIVSFAMLFLTDYIGLSAGVVAMLIAVSKILDAVTDIFAGTIIDRTKHKWGKARIWILRMIPLMVVTNILFFFMPTEASDTVKYIYFFVTYTIFSDLFYTMFGIANNTMMLYATKNTQERVYMSMATFIGTVLSSIMVTATYMGIIAHFGGGVEGWRMLAIIFSIIFTIAQLIYVFSIRELPQEEEQNKPEQGIFADLVKNIKFLFRNKFFLEQLGVMLLYTMSVAASTAVIPYYCIRVLGDAGNVAGTQTYLGLTASGTIIGLLFSALFIKKFGMYKSNLYTRILVCAVYVIAIIGGVTGNFPLLLLGEALFYVFQGPYLGTVGALLGEVCEYSKLKDGVSIEATVSSCNSFGTKVGNALGVACVGALLQLVHYDGMLDVQPESSLNMIRFIFLAFPIICQIIIAILLSMMNIEKANKELREKVAS